MSFLHTMSHTFSRQRRSPMTTPSDIPENYPFTWRTNEEHPRFATYRARRPRLHQGPDGSGQLATDTDRARRGRSDPRRPERLRCNAVYGWTDGYLDGRRVPVADRR